MSGIVCAIRGGPDSDHTIEEAITLAKETGQHLIFLYVVNLDFLSHTSHSRVQTISKEMHQLGDFILLNAQARAEARNTQADTVVRHGNVGEEIIQLSREIDAEYVVLGEPSGQGERDTFTQERLHQFIEHIENAGGVKVILAER